MTVTTSRLLGLSLLVLCALHPPRAAAAVVTVVADPSDAEVFGSGGVGQGPGGATLGDLIVGDTGGGNPSFGRRAVMRFDIQGLTAASVASATLRLNIIESRRDQFPAPGIIDGTPPFTNPGLGDTRVVHIPNFTLASATDYGSPSVGNDPGVLIPAGVDAGAVVSVDATLAVRQALMAGESFVAFRVQTAVETDNDGLNDAWAFNSANWRASAVRPRLDIDTTGALANPRVLIDLNTNSLSTGQTLIVTFKVTPGTPSRPVDAYVLIQSDSRFFSFQPGGTFVPGVVPFVRNVTPVAAAGELLRYTLTGLEVPGGYGLIVGLTDPGTLTPVSPVEVLTLLVSH